MLNHQAASLKLLKLFKYYPIKVWSLTKIFYFCSFCTCTVTVHFLLLSITGQPYDTLHFVWHFCVESHNCTCTCITGWSHGKDTTPEWCVVDSFQWSSGHPHRFWKPQVLETPQPMHNHCVHGALGPSDTLRGYSHTTTFYAQSETACAVTISVRSFQK